MLPDSFVGVIQSTCFCERYKTQLLGYFDELFVRATKTFFTQIVIKRVNRPDCCLDARTSLSAASQDQPSNIVLDQHSFGRSIGQSVSRPVYADVSMSDVYAEDP
jgi:hypothetical protein